MYENNSYMIEDTQLLNDMLEHKYIDYKWQENEIMFGINVYKNNRKYIEDNYQSIKESRIQCMFILSVATNSTDRSVFTFLNKVWIIDKNYKNEAGNNCLMIACMCNGNLDVIKYLINDIKMDTKQRNNDGLDCLLFAAENPNLEIIKYLINDQKMDTNSVDNNNDNILTTACMHNDNVEMIRYLVNDVGMPINHMDVNGNNCLMAACTINQNLDIITFLINELKFDVNLKNNLDFTCLELACQQNSNLDVIKYLLKENEFNKFNEALVRACAYNNNLDIIKYFINDIGCDPGYLSGYECLIDRCLNSNNLEIIKYLINDLKMDHRYKNPVGIDCFLAACMNPNPDLRIIKYLIKEVGMDVNSEDQNGMNALHFISNEEIINYLINIENINIIVPSDYKKFENICKLINDCDKFNRVISDGFMMYTMKEMSQIVKQRNPFELTKWHMKIFKINPFIDKDYKQCVELINGLQCKTNIPKLCYKNKKKFNPISHDFSKPLEILFKYNGNVFYGHRDIVYKQMNLSNVKNKDNIIVLEGNLPKDIMNQYISAQYTGSINLKTIPIEHFIDFLKFIDMYPTSCCSIDQSEEQIIKYINENDIKYDDYLKELCDKYQLKSLYLDYYNKKF